MLNLFSFSIILNARQLEYLEIWGVKPIDFEHHSEPQTARESRDLGVSNLSMLSIILNARQLGYLAIWGVKSIDVEHHPDPRQLEYLAIGGVKPIDVEHHCEPLTSRISGDLGVTAGVRQNAPAEVIRRHSSDTCFDVEHDSEPQTARVSGDLGCQIYGF